MTKMPVTSFDIFYISYDEPKKEQFWAHLLDLCPWAKRIDNVKGFDSVHRACAAQSETDFLITVDGDNLIDTAFFDQVVDIDPDIQHDWAWSWNGRNHVNGLVYGNGGLKLWSKKFIMNMNSHENATNPKHLVDFCWNEKYSSLKGCWSTTYTNATPFQSFRAGYREGVKMVLDRGLRMTKDSFRSIVDPLNYQRLIIWMSVGADVENGLWSIYGTRLGALNVLLENWDYSKISDYSWFDEFWNNIRYKFEGQSEYCILSNYKWNKELLLTEIKHIGDILRKEANINVGDLGHNNSKFFRDVVYYEHLNKIRNT
jgi:hypothetical protein